MKKFLFFMGLLWSTVASAQFTPGQLLTAAELNSQFALYAPLTGATYTGPVVIPTLTVTGAASLPAGTIPPTGLTSQAANTALANVTGSSASPTAAPLPSCSTTTSSLQYTSGVGFSCFAGSAPLASPTFTGTVTIPSGASISGYALLASPTFTGTPSAPTATATTNTTQIATTAMVNSTVTGGSLAGAFTTLSSSGAFTPAQTAGIVGTTTNNNANAGSVGEYQTTSGSGVSLTSASPGNALSISLTAGDWDVQGSVQFVPSGTTTIQLLQASVSTTSATPGALGALATMNNPGTTSGIGHTIFTPTVRISVASTTTVYLVATSTFSISTLTVNSFIRARRIR